MQTTRREIDSFISRKSFKYNDVIDSKIVNLDIWHHFQFLNESSRELESSIDSRSISDWVRMLKSSIRVESEDWYRVLELSQKIDIETRLDNQSTYMLTCWSSSIFWMISIICDQSFSLNEAYKCLYFIKALCLSFENSQLYDECYNTLLAALLFTFIVSLNVFWYFIVILLAL